MRISNILLAITLLTAEAAITESFRDRFGRHLQKVTLSEPTTSGGVTNELVTEEAVEDPSESATVNEEDSDSKASSEATKSEPATSEEPTTTDEVVPEASAESADPPTEAPAETEPESSIVDSSPSTIDSTIDGEEQSTSDSEPAPEITTLEQDPPAEATAEDPTVDATPSSEDPVIPTGEEIDLAEDPVPEIKDGGDSGSQESPTLTPEGETTGEAESQLPSPSPDPVDLVEDGVNDQVVDESVETPSAEPEALVETTPEEDPAPATSEAPSEGEEDSINNTLDLLNGISADEPTTTPEEATPEGSPAPATGGAAEEDASTSEQPESPEVEEPAPEDGSENDPELPDPEPIENEAVIGTEDAAPEAAEEGSEEAEVPASEPSVEQPEGDLSDPVLPPEEEPVVIPEPVEDATIISTDDESPSSDPTEEPSSESADVTPAEQPLEEPTVDSEPVPIPGETVPALVEEESPAETDPTSSELHVEDGTSPSPDPSSMPTDPSEEPVVPEGDTLLEMMDPSQIELPPDAPPEAREALEKLLSMLGPDGKPLPTVDEQEYAAAVMEVIGYMLGSDGSVTITPVEDPVVEDKNDSEGETIVEAPEEEESNDKEIEETEDPAIPLPEEDKSKEEESTSTLIEQPEGEIEGPSPQESEQPEEPTPEDPLGETEEPMPEPENPVGETEEPTPEPEDPVGETEEPTPEPEDPVGETEEPTPEPEEPTPEDPVGETEEPTPEPEDPVGETDEPTPTAPEREEYLPEEIKAIEIPSIQDWSKVAIPEEIKKPESFPNELPPVYLEEEEGEPESSPVLPTSALSSRGVSYCQFSSNLIVSILFCNGGKLILQDATGAESMYYYTLPDEFLPSEGETFKVFSSSSQTSLALVGSKIIRITAGSAKEMEATLVADFRTGLTSQQLAQIVHLTLIETSKGYLKLVDPSTDKGQILLFMIADVKASIAYTIELPYHYVTWNTARTFITFDNMKIIQADAMLKVFYLDPAQRLRVVKVDTNSGEATNSELKVESLLPEGTISGLPSRIDSFLEYLVISYPADEVIVVLKSSSFELIKVVYVNPNFFKEAGSELLKIGKIQDSEAGSALVNPDFKVVYTAKDAKNEDVVAVNEVHFYFNEGDLMVFEFEKVLVDDTASDSAFNFLEKPYYFISSGTSLVFAEEQGSTELKSFVQCRYDQFYQPPQVGRRRSLSELIASNSKRALATSSSEEIEGFTPASPVKCPDKHGTGNPYVTKFQATECTHCKDLYDYAIAKGESTGITQTYDITVAKSLCSDEELGIETDSDSNGCSILLIIFGGLGLIIIVLIAVMCTKDGWNSQQFKVNKAKDQPNIILSKTKTRRELYETPVDAGKKPSDDNANTSRHLMSEEATARKPTDAPPADIEAIREQQIELKIMKSRESSGSSIKQAPAADEPQKNEEGEGSHPVDPKPFGIHEADSKERGAEDFDDKTVAHPEAEQPHRRSIFDKNGNITPIDGSAEGAQAFASEANEEGKEIEDIIQKKTNRASVAYTARTSELDFPEEVKNGEIGNLINDVAQPGELRDRAQTLYKVQEKNEKEEEG